MPAAIATPYIATLGDSITAENRFHPYTPYPDLLALLLPAKVVDLGVGGQTIGPHPDFRSPDGTFIISQRGVLAEEVPRIPEDATIVTLMIGTNDIFEANLTIKGGGSDADDAYAAAARSFASELTRIVAAIRARVPNARLLIATLVNTANRGSGVMSYDTIGRTRQTRFIAAMNRAIVATGAEIVDLSCQPEMYDNDYYHSPTDVHPNAAGQALIASAFARAILHPKPPKACAYEGVIPRAS